MTSRHRPADRALSPWGAAAAEILRAGPSGNAVRIRASEALLLLTQWNETRRAGIAAAAACWVLVLFTLTGCALLALMASSMEGFSRFGLGAAAVTLATAFFALRIWRMPLATALVRYRIVHP